RLWIVSGLFIGLNGGRAAAEEPELAKPRIVDGGDFRGIAFTADGKSLVVAGNKTGLRLVEVATGKVSKTFEVPERGTGPIAISPDSKWIAVQGWDGQVRVWDVVSGKIVHTSLGKGNTPIEVGFTPDG